MADNARSDALCRAIATCIHPDDGAIKVLGDLFTDDATVWSPNLMASGLADIAESVAAHESAFTDVEITFDSVDVFGNKGVAEFRVSAKFTGPFVIDEEQTIEPNGQTLLLGAAAVADFDGGKIEALRAYFDDATLLEQMVAG